MQHSVSNSEWITINMICSRQLQPHYNPITYGILIFISILEKKWGGGGGLYLPLQKRGAIDPGGGGYWPGGGIFTYILWKHMKMFVVKYLHKRSLIRRLRNK